MVSQGKGKASVPPDLWFPCREPSVDRSFAGEGEASLVLTLSQVSTGNVEGIHFALSRFVTAYGSVEGERVLYHKEMEGGRGDDESKGKKTVDRE